MASTVAPATVLGLDYYSLQKRAKAADTPAPPSGPAFVELTSPVIVARQCRVELDNGSGDTMRVELVGYDAADLEAAPHAASGTPADAPDHAPDEDPRRRRAGRFPTRDRWSGATLSGDPSERPVRRRRLRLPQSQGDGPEAAHVRRPGILALPQAVCSSGPPPVVACGRGRWGCNAWPHISWRSLLSARRPDANGRAGGGRLRRPVWAAGLINLDALLQDRGRIASLASGGEAAPARGRRPGDAASGFIGGCRMRTAPGVARGGRQATGGRPTMPRAPSKRLDEKDSHLIRRLFESYAYVSGLIEDKNTSIRHLRQLFFGSRTEKTEAVVGAKAGKIKAALAPRDNAASDGSSADDANSDASDDSTVPRGHGRNGAEAYQGARVGPTWRTRHCGWATPVPPAARGPSTTRCRACWCGSPSSRRAVRELAGLSVAETPMQLVRPGLHCGVACRGRSEEVRRHRRQHDRALEIRKRTAVQPPRRPAGGPGSSAAGLDPAGTSWRPWLPEASCPPLMS